MRRRQFLGVLAGTAAWPRAISAQTTVSVIGFLTPQVASVGFSRGLDAGLRELGYTDGRNIRIESRGARGRFEELPHLAAELVRLNPAVLVASLTQASLVARNATTKIPIVMAGVGDPVTVGLVGSLARPGGNITGTSSVSVDLVGKQLELLKEIAPDVSRVAVLWNPANAAFQALQLQQAEQAARVAGFRLQLLDVRTKDEINAAFANVRSGTKALAVLGDPLFGLNVAMIAELALKNRLVTVSSGRDFADGGLLLTYGASLYEAHKRAAVYVDKILKGAAPADLPVEQPTTFEMVINLQTAKALGVTVPPSLLARANEVIE